MINFSLICKSNRWSVRFKKVNAIIKNILSYKKDLKFDKSIIYSCNIILTDNKFITKMNYMYRNIKKPTDVLTFVSEIDIQRRKKEKISDIFLSAEIVNKDAKLNKITFYNHLAHILIHSFLHINGFNHEKNKDFEQMKNIEIKLLKKLGISNPYLQ